MNKREEIIFAITVNYYGNLVARIIILIALIIEAYRGTPQLEKVVALSALLISLSILVKE